MHVTAGKFVISYSVYDDNGAWFYCQSYDNDPAERRRNPYDISNYTFDGFPSNDVPSTDVQPWMCVTPMAGASGGAMSPRTVDTLL